MGRGIAPPPGRHRPDAAGVKVVKTREEETAAVVSCEQVEPACIEIESVLCHRAWYGLSRTMCTTSG